MARAYTWFPPQGIPLPTLVQLGASLDAVLVVGNTTGGSDLDVSTGDTIAGVVELALVSDAGAITLTATGGAVTVTSGVGGDEYTVASGTATGATTSGAGTITTGGAATGASGQLNLLTGNVSAGTDQSGDIDVISGTSFGGATGQINVKSGAGPGATGDLVFKSGNASAGNSGDIIVDVGTASGSVGQIDIGEFNASSVNLGNASGPVVKGDDVRSYHGSGLDVFQQGELTTLTDGSATTVFSVVMGDGDMAGIKIDYTIQMTDATEFQSECGTAHIAIVDDAGGVVASTPGVTAVQALSSGTLSVTWTVVTTDDQSVEIQVDANSSLSTSTSQIRWLATCSGDVTLVVP